MWIRRAFDGAAIGEVNVDDGKGLDLERATGFSVADTLGHRAVDAGTKTSF